MFAGTTSGLGRLPIVAARCLNGSANGILARTLNGGISRCCFVPYRYLIAK